jgi:hypothetical protein
MKLRLRTPAEIEAMGKIKVWPSKWGGAAITRIPHDHEALGIPPRVWAEFGSKLPHPELPEWVIPMLYVEEE